MKIVTLLRWFRDPPPTGYTAPVITPTPPTGAAVGPLLREARLKPEFADLYRGLPADVWEVAANMVEKLIVLQRHRNDDVPAVPGGRVLNDENFEFRGAIDSVRRQRIVMFRIRICKWTPQEQL